MSARSNLKDLKVGDGIEGYVAEQISGGDLIISFDGELLRVANASRRIFKPGDRIHLAVTAVRPLRFRILSDSASGTGRGFHVLG